MRALNFNPGKGERRKQPIIRRAGKMLALASAMVLLSATMAMADNVQNDVVAGGNDTITVGGSTTVSYRIQATGQGNDGQNGCNAADTTPATVTINAPADVTVSPSSLDFNSCGLFKSTTFTASAAGNYPITVSVSDAGVGTYTVNQAAFTLKVLAPSDTTAPTAAPTQSPAANGNGWNNSDVTVTWNWSDAGGIDTANCAASSASSGEGTQTLNATCKDLAGNIGNASHTVKVDKTDPTVGLVGGPVDGASYPWGSVPAAPTCSASDILSDIDGPCVVSGYGESIGSHTVKATAKDNAGNSAAASANYSVEKWNLQGFFNPVDMGFMNTVKGGSTVPLKFRVFAGANELTNTSAIMSSSPALVSCTPGMDTAPVEELAATGGTVLRYDTTSGHFIYNWKTPKLPGKCYKVTLTTLDGSKITADFKLT